MVTIDDERRRLIVTLLLTLFFLGFILINVTYQAGMIYLVLSMICLVVTIFWHQIPKARPERKLFALQKDWYVDLLIGLVVGVALIFLSTILPGFAIAVPKAPQATAFPTPMATAGQWLTIAGAAPLVEEIAFRTVLFAVLFIVIGLGFFWSAFISSGAFALYHISAYAGEIALSPIIAVSGAFITAFIFSIIFCYLNKWRGSVTSSMGAHGAINGGYALTQLVVV